jgi:hypothetical protein
MEFIGFAFVQLVLLVLGAGAGAVCMLVVRRATRDVPSIARRASLIALALPLVTIFYVETGILCYGIAEYAVGKDSFVDGIYHCPLVNGYQLVVMDKMPEMASIEQRSGTEVVGEVRAVQVAGDLLFVATHEGRDKTDWGADKPANRYFTIDTRTFKLTNYPTLDALRSDAAIHQISLLLVPTESVLGRAVAFAWPGRIFFLVLLAPPVILTAWLVRRLGVLRRRTISIKEPHGA